MMPRESSFSPGRARGERDDDTWSRVSTPPPPESPPPSSSGSSWPNRDEDFDDDDFPTTTTTTAGTTAMGGGATAAVAPPSVSWSREHEQSNGYYSRPASPEDYRQRPASPEGGAPYPPPPPPLAETSEHAFDSSFEHRPPHPPVNEEHEYDAALSSARRASSMGPPKRVETTNFPDDRDTAARAPPADIYQAKLEGKMERLARLRGIKGRRSVQRPSRDDSLPPPQSALVKSLLKVKKQPPKVVDEEKTEEKREEEEEAFGRSVEDLERERESLREEKASLRVLREEHGAVLELEASRRAKHADEARDVTQAAEVAVNAEKTQLKKLELAAHRNRRTSSSAVSKGKRAQLEALRSEAQQLRADAEVKLKRDRANERRVADRARDLTLKITELEAHLTSLRETQLASVSKEDETMHASALTAFDSFDEEQDEEQEQDEEAASMLLDAATLGANTLGGATRLEVSYDAGRYAQSSSPNEEEASSSHREEAPPGEDPAWERGRSPKEASSSQNREEAPPGEDPAWEPRGSLASPGEPTGRDGMATPGRDGRREVHLASSSPEEPAWQPAGPASPGEEEPAWAPTGRDGKMATPEGPDGRRDLASPGEEGPEWQPGRDGKMATPEGPEWVPGRDGKMERTFPDGRREVLYRNGTRKEVDGPTSIVRFTNGDEKRTEEDAIVYFYAEAKTTHTTVPSTGLEIFEFPNGQVERHARDGTKNILFPDGTHKLIKKGEPVS